MKPADLLDTLVAFHKDKLTLRQRHSAVARQVGHYAFNNTYQYVIAREDVHLSWLEAAIAELSGTPAEVDEPALPALGRKTSITPVVAEDARAAGEFVARWRPRVAEFTNARHRGMMDVVLGETLEHERFFEQIVEGREDVLGRRANGPKSPGTGDGVLGVRWIG